MSILLFEHNQKAYDSAIEMLNEYKKAAIIHPTGTGKSFIGFKLCEENKDKKICWISPSEYIFKTQIENVLKVDNDFCADNITFITYAKLMLMSEEQIKQINPDYIILDEFHRAGATKWGSGIERIFEFYKEIPVLGLSATHIRYLDNQRNMAEELFEGCVASQMTLGEAIVRGILTPPKYVLSIFSYAHELEKYNIKIKKLKNKQVKERAEKQLNDLRRALEKADGLDDIFAKHITEKHGKYIVFCANVEHMREMIDRVPEWFCKVDSSAHVYSAYSDNPEASIAFSEFKDDKSEHLKLLFCIDMLNEGIHVEDISGVILLRPTVSPIIYKQQIGRALSASKSKNAVIFDIVLNFENLYSISDIKEEMAGTINFYHGIGEEKEIVNEHFHVIDEVRDCREIFNELEHILTLSWDDMYMLAKQYYEENGNLLPKSDYKTEDGYNLGQWIVTQRIQYMNNALSDRCIKKLEKIGMSWETLKERQWEKGFSEASKYYEEHGNLNVPRDKKQLYAWILSQRSNYRSNKITTQQYERLSQIGMIWELEDSWMLKYNEAKRYFEQNGNLDIPADFVSESGVNLGKWYRSVRSNYRDNVLSEERKKLLEDIGIDWVSVKVRTWMSYYDEAKKYYDIHQNLNVKSDYVTENGLKLGIWISSQRTSYKEKRLTQEQINLLEEIKMSWHRDKSRWETGFEHAKEYFEEYGNINPNYNYVCDDGFALGAWINSQRLKYKNNKLKKNYIDLLEGLNIIWFKFDAAWEMGFEQLNEFCRMNGNCNVSSSYVTDNGFKLGRWVANQKVKYKTNKLSFEKIKKLESVGIVWNSHEEKWLKAFEYAKEYKTKYNARSIPYSYVADDGFKLGEWYRSQKRQFEKGDYDNGRLLKLSEIGISLSHDEISAYLVYTRDVAVI